MSDPIRRDVLGTLLPGFVGTALPSWVEAMLREGLGGVCLFGENIVSTAQLEALTAAILVANPAALIAIDEEGGDVTRLFAREGSPFPGNAVLGRLDDLEATRAVGAAVGAELRAAGVNLDFAPDVDINSNPQNPVIGIRSFGASAELVSRHSAAWTEGLQSQGVAACPKHFPGHGDTAQDSHLALPTVDLSVAELRERELRPFAAAIEAGALTVMTSHILLPQLDAQNPATFSSVVLEGLLRGELGFEGVIVSDALDMVGASGEIGIPAAAVRALSAGCDLLCIGTKNTAEQLERIVATVVAAVGSGGLDPARLASATARLARLTSGLAELSVPADVAGLTQPASAQVMADAATDARIPDAARVATAFRVAPEADAVLKGAGWVVVRVDTVANIAVGVVPWGPFRALHEAGVHLGVYETTEDAWREEIEHIPREASVLMIGKDNGRRPQVRALIAALRERHTTVVTVDMGWPGDEPGAAQLATFGASELVGEALAGLLVERGVRS